ncbi:MAG: HPr(Ser) kinase/phosphatase [Xanthomonadales bacterium]|nr:HPr(Ser) kinase/phosphatase [Xanthomonadales bacterium]
MSRLITAQTLYDDLRERLQLCWVSGQAVAEEQAISADELTARPTVAGFLNLIHPNRVQVLGLEEIQYLRSQGDAGMAGMIGEIFAFRPVAVIVGDSADIPEPLAEAADRSGTPLIRSGLPAHELADYLQYHISHSLAQRTTLHGVFMEIFTIGVLITGGPGSGKSELALELLTRGHRLIADDAPDFTQISPEIIDGTCPEALQDCLEVRGLGVLNVRHMFGDAAVKLNKFLRLIVHLEIPSDPSRPAVRDRLHGDNATHKVLDLEIPRITLPVMAGRNLAVITEAAVRDFMLKMKGYDAASAFIERHTRLIQRQNPGEVD